MPRSPLVAQYRRAAWQRLEESEFLISNSKRPFSTAAINLGGYSVECMFKALMLATYPQTQHMDVRSQFRGARGHDLEWIKARYLANRGAHPPREIDRDLKRVFSWSTDLRYETKSAMTRDANAFLKSCKAILRWGERILP